MSKIHLHLEHQYNKTLCGLNPYDHTHIKASWFISEATCHVCYGIAIKTQYKPYEQRKADRHLAFERYITGCRDGLLTEEEMHAHQKALGMSPGPFHNFSERFMR